MIDFKHHPAIASAMQARPTFCRSSPTNPPLTALQDSSHRRRANSRVHSLIHNRRNDGGIHFNDDDSYEFRLFLENYPKVGFVVPGAESMNRAMDQIAHFIDVLHLQRVKILERRDDRSTKTLTRKHGQKIFIGDDICITVVAYSGSGTRIRVECPNHVRIVRGEQIAE